MTENMPVPGIAKRNQNLCIFCGACRNNVNCPAGEIPGSDCIGCGACVLACPGEAMNLAEGLPRIRNVNITVNGRNLSVPERTTLRAALEFAGISFSGENLKAPCSVGGCWCCAVLVDGIAKPACITGVKEGMVIDTHTGIEPKRVVTGFGPHMVGGVGTPVEVKSYVSPVEVALFTHGCNFRCPQCQNHIMAFTGGMEMSSRQAALMLSNARRIFGVHRMAFSGGECTLNRPWLIRAVKELKMRNPDEKARIHVDTNGSLLTCDYLEELVEAGMTDAGIDLKGSRLATFQIITGIADSERARSYLENAWDAVKYLLENHPRVFVGIGIPYNKALISKEEIREIGERIANFSKTVQVCVLDYRAAFRRNLEQPTLVEMNEIKDILNLTGLKKVIAQTPSGHIGP